MKLKILAYIAVGFLSTWLASALAGEGEMLKMLTLLPLVGLVHELMHLLLIKSFRLKYVFLVNGLYIGFRAVFQNVGQLLATAMAPQVITLALTLTHVVTGNAVALSLALLHVAISVEDIAKALRYLSVYSA